LKSPIPPDIAPVIAAGLLGLMDVEQGPTEEQWQVFHTFSRHLLHLEEGVADSVAALDPNTLAASLSDTTCRRVFTQLAIMLELCRHPKSEEQLHKLEAYAAALDFKGPQLTAVQDLAHKSAVEATADFLRVYDRSMPNLTELQFKPYAEDPSQADKSLWRKISELQSLPVGTLGREFAEFYQRNDLTLPGPDTPNPGYYVSHDMNHVIAGYEPTGPGEIALGIFKLMMNNNEANWMGSMVNFLIHEVGLFKHATTLQFVPYGGGGEPYHGLEGSRGALTMDGAPELVGEAFLRGSACSGDFSVMDHLAVADRPLVEIRRDYHVLPLSRSLRSDEDPALWPDNA
jgi:ubiquinone biosynthesis protein Coq4